MTNSIRQYATLDVFFVNFCTYYICHTKLKEYFLTDKPKNHFNKIYTDFFLQ